MAKMQTLSPRYGYSEYSELRTPIRRWMSSRSQDTLKSRRPNFYLWSTHLIRSFLGICPSRCQTLLSRNRARIEGVNSTFLLAWKEMVCTISTSEKIPPEEKCKYNKGITFYNIGINRWFDTLQFSSEYIFTWRDVHCALEPSTNL